jgi:hypothetical protein
LNGIFKKYFPTLESALPYERKPEKIANKVYGNRMGNNQPGDGYKYRGRGLIQLTGKNNYSMFGKIIGMDLVSNPDAASSLGTAADIAAAFYKKNVMDKGIDGSDTKAVTKAINGGSHGLSDRATKFASYMKSPEAMQATPAMPAIGGPEGPMLAQTVPPQIQQASGGAAPATETVAQPVMAAAAAPASIPATATPVTPTPASGYAVAAESTAVTAAREQMVAAAPAPSFVPVPVGSAPSPATMTPSGSAVKASARAAEDSFVRALAKDFAHPSAFTTIGTV